MSVLRSLVGDEAEILVERDFQAILLANIIAPLGTGLLSPVLDSMIGPFGTSAANIGLMISVFTAPAIVIIPVAGVLADRVGRKPILVAALVLLGVAGTAIAFTTDFRVALGLRLVQGIAFAGITPILITSIGDLYEGTREATGQGIRFTCSGLSLAVFPLLSGVVVGIAWYYPFLLYALAIPIAAVVYFEFDEPAALDESGGPTTDSRGLRSQLPSLFALVAQRRVYAMVVARGLPVVVWTGFLTYNSIVVVRVLEGTPTQAGIVVAVASVSYAVTASQAGRITAMFESRLYPLLGANGCLGVGFALFFASPSLVLAGLGMTITGVGFGLTMSLYRSIITGLASESLRGSLVSVAEAFGRVVGTVTPLCFGAAISVATPYLSVAQAVQAAGIGAAVVGSVGGVVCLLLVHSSPSVTHDA